MTRVEKINLAIEIMHTQKGMLAPEIKEYLRTRDIHLDIQVIQDVVRDLRFKPLAPTKIPKKAAPPWFSALQNKVEPLLVRLVAAIRQHNVPYSYGARLLNDLGVEKPLPRGGTWKADTLKSYLHTKKIYKGYPSGSTLSRRQLTYVDFCARIDPRLLKEFEEYSDWDYDFREAGGKCKNLAKSIHNDVPQGLFRGV